MVLWMPVVLTGFQSGVDVGGSLVKNPAHSFQFSSALRESESSCQNVTTGSFAVEPLNRIIVLILKHYYVSIWSSQMKCTLL